MLDVRWRKTYRHLNNINCNKNFNNHTNIRKFSLSQWAGISASSSKKVMSERERPCQWCKGLGHLPGINDCGLCFGTGLAGYSIGEEPFSWRTSLIEKRKSRSSEAMEAAVKVFEEMKR